jgi:hypothetical protein
MRDARYSTYLLPIEYLRSPEQEKPGMEKAILVPSSAGKLPNFGLRGFSEVRLGILVSSPYA